ncbi:hypothetical protein HPP92_020746 [Vanilla planifolia]|uniref:Uncharacterized protein n=1 Tax=Vanilla planifolia TaxID=51239 RepID=A0A835Q122_VANPL|nr:hypothetical protein HPP92_020746 [Vanilla planifolia]
MVVRIFTRCFCIVFFSLWVSFVLSFVLGFVAIALVGFSASNPVVVPSLCRILSSSVDIKFSRVCDLGFLNYKARNVFYPSKRTRFRCHDDYYWASVFRVEYKEHFSGQLLHAVAEALRRPLPQECRPGFDTAWMTTMKFKVNATYHCKYTLGSHKADIYPDNLLTAKAKIHLEQNGQKILRTGRPTNCIGLGPLTGDGNFVKEEASFPHRSRTSLFMKP